MEIYAKKQFSIIAFLYFGELSVGYLTGWPSPAVAKLKNPDESPLSTLVTDTEASLMSSVPFIGVIIGAQTAGFLANARGRKPCLIIGGMIFIGSHALMAASTEVWMLIIGRLLVGVGGGMVFIVNLAYIAEISSKNIRGVFLTGTGIANASGNLVGYCVGPYVSFRAINYLGIFMALVFSAGALLVPESPVFYVMKGKEIEAKMALVQLGRSSDVEEVLSSKENTSRKQEWLSIVSVKSNRKAMLIATVLLISQQTVGYAAIIFFGTTIFQSVASSISPVVATIIIGLTMVITSCITPMFVERSGRKALMLGTTGACFFSQVLLGTYFCLESLQPHLANQVHWLPLVSLMVFLLSYTIGFGIIPGTWMSEMFDSSARGPGSASAMTISWIFAFLITSLFSHMLSFLGRPVTFFMFSLSSAFAFLFTAVMVPETKGVWLRFSTC